jgi:hypothetical protein
MPLERLQRRARACVPEPDGRVVGSGRQLLAVRREGHSADIVRMPLERLQARTPAVLYSRLNINPFWLFMLEQLSY